MAINSFEQVATYNNAMLALLQNSYAFIETSNKKFERFNDDVPKNLGNAVKIRLPSRFTSVNSLVWAFGPVVDREISLVVDNPGSVSYAFTAQEFIFNAREFMTQYGAEATAELGAQVESNVAEVAESNTFRFYGDGLTPITTSFQIAEALAFFRNFGSSKKDFKCYLSDLTYPNIINSNLAQFAIRRNDEQAMSWMQGEMNNCKLYSSNLLKRHNSGSEGNAQVALTVVSVVKNADDAVIQITFSGTSAPSDANSIKLWDKAVFSDGVSGLPNIRFLTFVGHKPSECPVQFKVTADAASTAGSQVTVNIFPPLKASSGANQNVTNEIVAGMKVTFLPDHKCGLITGGDPLFLAMPRLPEETPFPTKTSMDPDSGCSMRSTYGTLLGQDKQGFGHSVIWGKTMPDEYAMLVVLPV